MKTVKIGFRGLMVFHKMPNYMEIGLINAPAHVGPATSHAAHVPRIITTKNGVVSSILDLRTRPELKPPGQPGHVRNWEIEVTNPLEPGVRTFTQGPAQFERLTHPYARDYRWITDMEGEDLHNRNLTDELDTTKFIMVLKVADGEFYTHQLSRRLSRRRANNPPQPTPFGMAAEVVGCDVSFELGEMVLKAGNTTVFRFNQGVEEGVIYEFSNAPPDVPHDRPYPNGPGHFAMYYSHLFRTMPADEFRLVPEGDNTPAPDPALCGATSLGDRGDLSL